MIRHELRDVTGRWVATHCREDHPAGKRMWWELPDGTSGLAGTPIADMPLYGIDRLSGSATVVVVEGEKAAEALWTIGVQAVATVTGASAIPGRAPLAELTGRVVLLWPDNDAVGRNHMDRIAIALVGIAASVEFIDWAEAPEHGDAADFVALGRSAGDVWALPIRSALLEEEPWAERIEVLVQDRSVGSAQSPSLERAERELPFQTAREFAAETPAVMEWIVPRYVAAGAITELEGKIKAAGKTTFALGLCRAVLDGSPFLGEPTMATAVVYLTEQPGSSLRDALGRAGLLGRDDFVLLRWSAVAAQPWSAVAAGAIRECRRRGAGLLVVDTLSRFTGIPGDGENSAGEAEAAMAPLQVATADGLGIILVRHERKAGGEVGDAGRGSTAFGGAVDILLALRRIRGEEAPNRRAIHALSRFEATPELLIIELTPAGYVALGTDEVVAAADARADVLEILRAAGSAGRRIDDLVTDDRPRTNVQRALDELLGARAVVRSGRGVKGDPFRFALVGAEDSTAVALIATPALEDRAPAGIEGLADLFRNLGSDIDKFGEPA